MDIAVRLGAAALGLASLSACWGRGPMVVGVDEPWWETAGETGDVVDSDTNEPSERGGLVVRYTFDPGLLGAETCAEAGLDVVSLRLTRSGDDPRSPIVYPCTDDALRVYDLPVGQYTVSVVGGEAPGVTWKSEPSQIYVAADEVGDGTALLVCHENDVDDGCGGA